MAQEPLWTIGVFDDSFDEFDSVPHDDPEVINFSVGNPISEFPNQVGTDIGPQRSIINIHFAADLSNGATLIVRWSAGGSGDEQFVVSAGGQPVRNSLLLMGDQPVTWVTEEFIIPPNQASNHTLSLTRLSGNGLWLDAISLNAAGSGSEGDRSDINRDGKVNQIDLLLFLSGWHERNTQ